jgi:hypothetical protein
MSSIPMARVLILALTTTLLPLPAHAQPWREAFEAGDYGRAATLLQPIVAISFAGHEADIDPAPSKALAMMYAKGLGVERDPVLACALAQQSEMALAGAAGSYANDIFRYLALERDAGAFREDLCDGLATSDQLAAANSVGCYKFGLGTQVLSVGPHSVRVDREGIALAEDGAVIGYDWECAQTVAGLRAVEVTPPPDALPGIATRYFVESVTSHLGHRDDRQLVHSRRWTLLEVTADGVGVAAQASLQPSGEWFDPRGAAEPAPALSIQMIRTGHVRWRIEGVPPLRGWLMQPGLAEGRR